MFRTIVEAVLRYGECTPEKLAIGFKQTRINYGTLCRQMKTAAVALKEEYGIKENDLVMLSAVSKPEYIVTLLAIQYLGAVSVPIDKSAKEENIKEIYHFISPSILLTDSRLNDDTISKVSLKSFYEFVRNRETENDENAVVYRCPDKSRLAELLFTTGTTGKPKGAMLTYGNIYASTHNTITGVGMLETDVILIPLPLNHSVGMRVLRSALYSGATVVVQNGFTFAKELETNISRFNCTALVSVPASMEIVMRQMQDRFSDILGGLRYIEFGAGSLSYDMKKKLSRILPNTTIFNTWGSTETGGAIFLNVSERQDKLTSLGRPVEGIRLKVVDAKGNAIEAKDIDTCGRMVLQGDMMMAGYFKMEKETEQTLVDGWLYTNDMVYTDEEGFVYMLGRADDIINVGGEKVSPIEVENLAQEYEQIRECACIGVEDPQGVLGQIPVLYVVPEGAGFDTNECIRFMASRMEKYKLPQKILFIEELPRNRMKKLDRKALKARWEKEGDAELMNDVVRAILSRGSVRSFKEQEIPRAHLEMIVKSGIQAPSGNNMQTWKFTVVQNKERIASLRQIIRKVADGKGVKVYGFEHPDTLILVSNDRRNPNGVQDSACAAENMMLAAQSYGIGSVWLNPLRTICDETEIRTELKKMEIPDSHIVWSMVALGYPDKIPTSPARKGNVVKWID